MLAGAAVPLLERETELAQLEQAVGEALEGRGALAVVIAHAGVGKTRLLDHARELATEAGMTVCHARGSEIEREFAFGVVRQLVDPLMLAAGAERRAELLDGPAAGAAALLGGAAAAPAVPGLTDASYATLHGLYWLLATLAERAPLALLVDDAHWADEPSLRFLDFLGRRIDGLPILVLAGARPEPEPLLEALEAGAGTVLRPQPLSPEAARGLVVRAFPGASDGFAAACVEATGGNPFLLGELLAAVAGEGIAPDDASRGRVRELGPAGVRRAVAARVRAISPQAAELAAAVAVLGPGADLRESAALAGVSEAAAAQAAEALAAAGILAPRRPLEFVHPILARAIDDETAPARRAEMHAVAARRRADAGASPEAVAAHLLGCEPAGDEWVVGRLEAAAAQALERGAPDVAVRLLRRALAEPPDAAAAGRVLGALGSAEIRLPGAPGAVEHLRRSVELAQDPGERLGRSLELGQALLMAGRIEDAVVVLRAELDALPDALAMVGLALQAVLLVASYASPAARREVAAAGWRFTGRDAPPEGPADRLWLAARACELALSDGHPDECARLARMALDGGRFLAEQSADSPVYYLAANTLVYADALEEAEATFAATVADARRRGSVRGFAMASGWRGLAAHRRGCIAEAIAEARDTQEAVRQGGLSIGMPLLSAVLVDALVDAGELDLAQAEMPVVADVAAEAGDNLMIDMLVHAEGRLHFARGRFADALERFETVGRRQAMWGVRGPGVVTWRSSAAMALAALGREEEARTAADEGLALAEAYGSQRALGIARRARGAVADGRPEAIEHLEAAVGVLAATPARLEHAAALVELGSALRRAGHRVDAREPLREGLDVARRCGGARTAARAYDELTASGVNQRRMLRAGVEALTPSERRIAKMAAEGMSNRDIAAALFVTVRTVETHLGHVYRKLDLKGRAGLAAALR